MVERVLFCIINDIFVWKENSNFSPNENMVFFLFYPFSFWFLYFLISLMATFDNDNVENIWWSENTSAGTFYSSTDFCLYEMYTFPISSTSFIMYFTFITVGILFYFLFFIPFHFPLSRKIFSDRYPNSFQFSCFI